MNGNLVKSFSKISFNYLKGYFVIDFVSSIPTDNLTKYEIFNAANIKTVYLRLLKVPKYTKIFRVWVNMFSNKLDDFIGE